MEFLKICGEGNAYLLKRQGKWVLIDTSAKEFGKKLEMEISKLLSPEKISYVLLTHLHFDHCENADLFPSARLFASVEEIEDFRNDSSIFFFGRKTIQDFLLEKLEPLPERILGLEVLKLPGHTRGSVAFLDGEKKRIFSGDTLFHHGIGRTDFPNSVPEKMAESVSKIQRIIAENSLELMPGHDY